MERPSALDLIAQAAKEKYGKLNLSGMHLSELPSEIWELTNLTSLDLSYNQLNSLPESVSLLTNLTSLCLRNNQLKALPESISQLTGLKTIHFSSNQLNALPKSIGQLTNLTTLYLSNRQFKTEVQRLEVFPGGTHKDILVFTTTIGYPDEIQPSYTFRERSAICTACGR